MARQQSKGTCSYCGQAFSKGGMIKHLGSCAERKVAIATAEAKKTKSTELYQLRVQDAYIIDFWLDLEMPGSKTLEDLDFYLRGIWLECCGHMSDFFQGGAFAHKIGMKRKISEVFKTDQEITHVYDFGTSSETLVKCVGKREGKPLTSKAVALMSRNNQPEVECMECGKPATHLCLECQYEEGKPGTLCKTHVKDHPHEDYGDPMPLVNSPRVGMCGYDGPAKPPY